MANETTNAKSGQQEAPRKKTDAELKITSSFYKYITLSLLVAGFVAALTYGGLISGSFAALSFLGAPLANALCAAIPLLFSVVVRDVSLRNQNRIHQATIESLGADKIGNEIQNHALELKNSKILEETESLIAQFEELTVEKDALEQKVIALEGAALSDTQSITALTTANAALTQEKNQSSEDLDIAVNQYALALEEVGHLKHENAALEKYLADEKTITTALSQINESKSEQINKLEIKVNAVTASLAKAIEQKDAAALKIETHVALEQNKNLKIESLETAAKQNALNLNKIQASTNETITKLEENLHIATSENTLLSAVFENEKNITATLSATIAVKEQEIGKLVKKLNAVTAALAKTIDERDSVGATVQKLDTQPSVASSVLGQVSILAEQPAEGRPMYRHLSKHATTDLAINAPKTDKAALVTDLTALAAEMSAEFNSLGTANATKVLNKKHRGSGATTMHYLLSIDIKSFDTNNDIQVANAFKRVLEALKPLLGTSFDQTLAVRKTNGETPVDVLARNPSSMLILNLLREQANLISAPTAPKSWGNIFGWSRNNQKLRLIDILGTDACMEFAKTYAADDTSVEQHLRDTLLNNGSLDEFLKPRAQQSLRTI